MLSVAFQWIGILAVVALCGVGIHSLWRRYMGRPVDGGIKSVMKVEELRSSDSSTDRDAIDIGCDVRAVDRLGQEVFRTQEIAKWPNAMALADSPHDPAMVAAAQLLGEVFKGSVTIPNKTIEVIFDPHVLNGLQTGDFELLPAKSGGEYLDARDASGKIVGKGRVVEGGQARQMTAVAMQLLSVAVAQYHLADIAESLRTLSKDVEAIRNVLAAQDFAELSAADRYADECIRLATIKGSPLLSVERRTVVEACHVRLIAGVEKLREQLPVLLAEIDEIKAKNMVGLVTDSVVARYAPLLGRVEFFQKTYGVMQGLILKLDLVRSWQDPLIATVDTGLHSDMEIIGDEFGVAISSLYSKIVGMTLGASIASLDKHFERTAEITSHCEQIEASFNLFRGAYWHGNSARQKAIDNLTARMSYAIRFDERGNIAQLGLIAVDSQAVPV